MSLFHVVDSHSTEFWRTADKMGKVSVPAAHTGDRTTHKQGHRRQQGWAPSGLMGGHHRARGIPQIPGERLQDRLSVAASLTVPKT